MPHIKACIFDLDGVIVETSQFHYKAWKRLAEELGIEGFNKEENEKLKGVSRMESMNIILDIGGRSLDVGTKRRLTDKKNGWYQEYIYTLTPDDILPGVKRFLDQLKSQDIKLGLASSSKNAGTIAEKIEIKSYFEAFIDGTKITNSKPHPEVFLKCSGELNVDPEYCVVFEDAAAGIDAAKNARMHCIGVGSPEVLGHADFVISSFTEMDPSRLDFALKSGSSN